jgi:hypothetical protein
MHIISNLQDRLSFFLYHPIRHFWYISFALSHFTQRFKNREWLRRLHQQP